MLDTLAGMVVRAPSPLPSPGFVCVYGPLTFAKVRLAQDAALWYLGTDPPA